MNEVYILKIYMGVTSNMALEAQMEESLEKATEYVVQILLEQEPIPEKDEDGEPINREDYIDNLRDEVRSNFEDDQWFYEDLINEYEGLTHEQRLAM